MLKRWIGYVSGCKTLMDVITQGRMGNRALEWQKLVDIKVLTNTGRRGKLDKLSPMIP
jgi:uncharacterized protein (DUF2235 family)